MRTNLSASFAQVPPAGPISGRARIIARNTFRYQTTAGAEIVRLHLTDVVTRDAKGRITLNSGGWKTKTTNDRINLGLQGTPYRLIAGRNGWEVARLGEGESYAWNARERVPFYDGIKLPDAFGAKARLKAEREAAKAAKLKERIKTYVTKNIRKGVPLAPPDSGDCWHCLMFDAVKPGSNPYTANESPQRNSADHLLSHIRENYLPGSLIVNAFRDSGSTDYAAQLFAFGATGPNVTETRRKVRRYLQKRLGLTF